ncbi:LuxR family transcriptional regulator [Neosynechococcus sphagnicola sy1]|uniref:LuxR family transcriptional regulator n=1 Tax=Neosynechococcus sphagnicola sy1 TaxID=1497020 RepID=A0A098TMR9_9CYAN|nr:response regulator transcription factor [Neosynechococcus sphagnicola]KGF73167.1 LuxR family transcriptional regulator [Neosynechococcus sphagnicola sy1]
MIRVLLVDDQSIIRQGLKALLQLEPDLEVVGDAENGQIALQQVAVLQPDVVLMDIRMPVMDGVAATQQICQRFSQTKVLVLTTFEDDEYVAAAIRVGAVGYLLKDTPSEELATAIRAIDKGYAQFGPGILQKMAARVPAIPPPSPSQPQNLMELTPRERQVLCLIAVGASNREIAHTLYISEGTVKNHVTNILNRLGLRDRTQAAIVANAHLSWLQASDAGDSR